MSGRSRRARRAFEHSLRVAERHEQRQEYAETLRARNRVAECTGLGLPGRRDCVAARLGRAERAARPPGRRLETPAAFPAEPVTLSMADRFETLLECGRRIAAALSPERVFAEVREAALRLLRAEQCAIYQVTYRGDTPEFVPLLGPADSLSDEATLRRAVQSGRALSFVEEMAEDTSESVVLAGERSVLCAPIFVRGQAAGCVYLTRRQVHERYNEDEDRIAGFVATLAGAALENAEGFRTAATRQRDPRGPGCGTYGDGRSESPGAGTVLPPTGADGGRTAADRRAAASRQGGRRGSQSSQEPVPGHDEPRDPHAHERDPGHGRVGAVHAA